MKLLARIDIAMSALKAGDFSSARAQFEVLASTGSKQALLALGNIYEQGGGGVHKDITAAKHWYERAFSEANSIAAALALGRLHYVGIDGAVDYKKAHFYLSKLENENEPLAHYFLGIMSEMGKGTPCDMGKARIFYRRASASKHIFARKNLGVLEIRRGSVCLGVLLWASAFIQGVWLSLINPYDTRMRLR
jgi:TPR repeat protein